MSSPRGNGSSAEPLGIQKGHPAPNDESLILLAFRRVHQRLVRLDVRCRENELRVRSSRKLIGQLRTHFRRAACYHYRHDDLDYDVTRRGYVTAEIRGEFFGATDGAKFI